MTLLSLLQPLLSQAALPIRDHSVLLIEDLTHQVNKSKQKLGNSHRHPLLHWSPSLVCISIKS